MWSRAVQGAGDAAVPRGWRVRGRGPGRGCFVSTGRWQTGGVRLVHACSKRSSLCTQLSLKSLSSLAVCSKIYSSAISLYVCLFFAHPLLGSVNVTLDGFVVFREDIRHS